MQHRSFRPRRLRERSPKAGLVGSAYPRRRHLLPPRRVERRRGLLVDLALDSPPNLPPSSSVAGPTFGLEELAGRKLLALFDRAEARDFADVYTLAERYDTDLLLHRAMQIDPGFDPAVLTTMIGSLNRFDDDEIPIAPCDVAALRDFFRRWQLRLQSGHAADSD